MSKWNDAEKRGELRSGEGDLEIRGNTIPHLHVHFFSRYAADRFEGRLIDPQGTEPSQLRPKELEEFVTGLRRALDGE